MLPDWHVLLNEGQLLEASEFPGCLLRGMAAIYPSLVIIRPCL